MDLGVVLEASWRLEAHGGVLEASWERLASIWRRVFKLQCLARGTCWGHENAIRIAFSAFYQFSMLKRNSLEHVSLKAWNFLPESMRRTRTRNTYSIFVESDFEACSQKMSKIMKDHVVSGVPKTMFFWWRPTRFPHFCILRSVLVLEGAWSSEKNNGDHRRARKRNTYTTFVPSEIRREASGGPKVLKTEYFLLFFGRKVFEVV